MNTKVLHYWCEQFELAAFVASKKTADRGSGIMELVEVDECPSTEDCCQFCVSLLI